MQGRGLSVTYSSTYIDARSFYASHRKPSLDGAVEALAAFWTLFVRRARSQSNSYPFLIGHPGSVGGGHLRCQVLSPERRCARGVKLGNPNGARALRGKQVGNKEAVAAIKFRAQEHASNLRSIVGDVRAQGITSIRKIAEELNQRGILAPRGGEWQPTTVVRLLARLSVQAGQ